jgi:hypothetical protein
MSWTSQIGLTAAARCAGGHDDSTTHRDRHQGRCADLRGAERLWQLDTVAHVLLSSDSTERPAGRSAAAVSALYAALAIQAVVREACPACRLSESSRHADAGKQNSMHSAFTWTRWLTSSPSWFASRTWRSCAHAWRYWPDATRASRLPNSRRVCAARAGAGARCTRNEDSSTAPQELASGARAKFCCW